MTKIYKVMNFQHQLVDTFENLNAAKERVDQLRTEFANEGFYVIEHSVVYSTPHWKS